MLDLQGELVAAPSIFGDGLFGDGLALVPCSEPQWSLRIEGEVRGLLPCSGTFAHLRGTVSYPADPCAPTLTVQEVVESRACEVADCFSPCEAQGCISFVHCTTYGQDCADADKCGPSVSAYRTVYDGANCSPLDAEPDARGNACEVYELPLGHDSCEAGSACLGSTQKEPGVCTPLCMGTQREPTCPPDRSCIVTSGGALGLCLTPCDPDASLCPAGSSCVARGGQTVCLDTDDLLRIVDDPDASD